MLFRWFFIKIGVYLRVIRKQIAYATLPRFGNHPYNLKIDFPRNISGSERIFLGDHVNLGPGCYLIAMTQYPSSKMYSPEYPLSLQTFKSTIIIGNRVTATANLQIFAQESVTVEDDVMFATNVFINDGYHGYSNGNIPYKYQQITHISPITIKRGCWIGQNVVVMPGVTIGEFSIIGANSVLNKSVPPRCIAVGSPASVIKQWDETIQQWVPTKKTLKDIGDQDHDCKTK